ncbi:hypothetical protein VTK26DRAFT_1307 [Humicola hyalothermophila]
MFGAEDQHRLRIPPEIQAQLDAEDEEVRRAKEVPGEVICLHDPHLLLPLRIRRVLSPEEQSRARCDVCGVVFRAFLLHCQACEALLCLGCRDALLDGQFWLTQG